MKNSPRLYKTPPQAGIAIKKALIDENKTIKEFAQEMNLSYAYVSQVLNGSKISSTALKKMCHYIGIKNQSTKV